MVTILPRGSQPSARNTGVYRGLERCPFTRSSLKTSVPKDVGVPVDVTSAGGSR